MARPSGRDIRQAAIDEASQAIQSGGVTGFSYGDLAKRIGVKAPSLHHHFPRKDELIVEALARYRRRFRDEVDRLVDMSPIDRIRRYMELFLEPAESDVLCLCGAAIVAWDDLSEAARIELRHFFDGELWWVEGQLTRAQQLGEVRSDLTPSDLARTLMAALEGALLLARTGTGQSSMGQTTTQSVAASLVCLVVPPRST